jgi:outer membrane protein TolC
VARALQGRPELSGLDSRAEALRAQARAETGKRLPQIALTAAYSHLESTILDREDFSTVGVGFSWALFDGGQARNRATALRRAGQAAELRAADARTGIQLEVRAAWLGLAEARARIGASREAVDQAEENLRISRELYGAGLATNTQVLDAVALRVGATANRDDAVLDAELARLALACAIGDL